MSDITLLSEFINVVLLPTVAILIIYVQKLTPKVKNALRDLDTIKSKAYTVLALLDKLSEFADDLTNAAASGDISQEESQALLAEVKGIMSDQAVIDLKEFVGAYK